VDTVVHFAAESHVDRSIFDPSRYWQTNVHGTATLLEEAYKLKIPRFHHISTDEVYGELPLDSKTKFSEKTPYSPRPDNLYAFLKPRPTRWFWISIRKRICLLQFPTVQTITARTNSPEKFVPIVITNLIDALRFRFTGTGEMSGTGFTPKTISSAIDLILQKGGKGETYLIGSITTETIITLPERSYGFTAKASMPSGMFPTGTATTEGMRLTLPR